MAIAKMLEFNLLAPSVYKDTLLHRLQLFRNVELHETELKDEKLLPVVISKPMEAELKKVEENIGKCEYVINLVSKYAPIKGGLKGFIEGLPNLSFKDLEKVYENFNFEECYSKVRKLGEELDSIEYRLIKDRESIDELSGFSGFDVTQSMLDKLDKTVDAIGGTPVKLASAFESRMKEIDLVYVEPIGIRKDEKVYLVIFHKDITEDIEEEFRGLSFSRTKLDIELTPKEKISKLRKAQEDLRKRKNEVIEEIKSFSKQIASIKEVFEHQSNLKLRFEEAGKMLETDSVSMVRGYILEEEKESFQNLVNEVTKDIYSLEFIDVAKDSEEVPIKLKNNRLVRAFESLTSTYALPKYNEVDPTPFFAIIYAIFFGMMAADAAYGIILLGGTTWALKKCNLTPNMKLMVKFFRTISFATIGWGIIYGSYFGAAIPGMWRLLDPSKDFMTILVMSIGIGVAHIYYGLGIRAYMFFRDRKPLDAVFQVFSWYVALTGAIVYLLSYFMKISGALPQIAFYTMLAGFVMILIGGMMGVEGNIGVKLGAGLYNLYGISGYVGDFVSYSRLMALGLSGGFIAFAINVIAGLLFKSPVGIPFAIIVLIVFHAFNLFLSFLGAYVHALRLIYVEFFGKFYEGGGRPFKVFRTKSRYINLDRQFEE